MSGFTRRAQQIAAFTASIVHVPDTIDMTGATDAGTAFTTWINTVPSGSIVDMGSGTLWSEETVSVTGAQGLTIRNGTLAAKSPGPTGTGNYSSRRHWLFTGCSNLTLENLHVTGPNTTEDPSTPGYALYDPTHEGEAAFGFNGCDGVQVLDCSSIYTFGDGLMVWMSPTTNLYVNNFTVSWNGRQGMSLSFADTVEFHNITITNSRRSGIDLEPDGSSGYVRNVLLDNVTAKAWLLALASAGMGDVSNITASNWTVTASGVPCVSVGASDGTPRHDWTVTGWNVTAGLGSPQSALRFTAVSNITISDNPLFNVASSQSRGAVSLSNCDGNVTITNNNWNGGLYIFNSSVPVGQVLTVSGNTPALTVQPS